MEVINKGFKFRAYPTKNQLELIKKTVHSCRFYFNENLAMINKQYENGETVKLLNPGEFKKLEGMEFLKEIDATAINSEWMHLNRARTNFFRDMKKIGKPKFKSRTRSKWSYTSKNNSDSIRVVENTVRVPKLGFLKIKNFKRMKDNYNITSATIELTRTGKVYVSLTFNYEQEKKELDLARNKQIGLDFSMSNFYVDSFGNSPKLDFLDKIHNLQIELKKEQRKLSRRMELAKKRKVKLSNAKNYQKQKFVVAKINEKIANIRKDFLHKHSRELADNYNLIAIEDLSVAEMSSKKSIYKFGKRIADLSYSFFSSLLDYKLRENGGALVKIDRYFPSSKKCSECGSIKENLKLGDRTYNCNFCEHSEDRDLNAAKNILKQGILIFNK